MVLGWPFRQYELLRDEFENIGQVVKAVDGYIEDRVQLLEYVPLPDGRKQKIRDQVEDCARAVLSRSRPAGLLRKAAGRCPRLIAVICLFGLLAGAGIYFAHPVPAPRRLGSAGFAAAWLVFYVLVILKAVLNNRFRRSGYCTILLFAEMVAAIVMVFNWRNVSDPVHRALAWYVRRAPVRVQHDLLQIPVGLTVHLVTWTLAFACIIAFVRSLVNVALTVLFRGTNFYSPSRYYSAVIINDLLVHTARLCAPPEYAGIALQYTLGKVRGGLGGLARIAAGPWAKRVSSAYPYAGPALRRCGMQMAVAMNDWQLRLAFRGDVDEVAGEMASALEHACLGEWTLIVAAGDYPASARVRRALKAARHLAGAVLAAGIAVASYVYLNHIVPPFYVQALVITFLGFGIAQVFSMLDPDAGGAFDTASKIGQMFKR